MIFTTAQIRDLLPPGVDVTFDDPSYVTADPEWFYDAFFQHWKTYSTRLF